MRKAARQDCRCGDSGVAGYDRRMLHPRIAPAKVSLGRFRGTDQTVEWMIAYALGPEGEQNLEVRQLAQRIVRDIAPKDYLSEILAVRNWTIGPWIRYTNDAVHVEQIKTPLRILMEIKAYGKSMVDCDEIACMIAALGMAIGREASLVTVGFGTPFHTHVFCRLKEPKSQQWIVCDPVAGSDEARMLQRVRSSKVYPVEP